MTAHTPSQPAGNLNASPHGLFRRLRREIRHLWMALSPHLRRERNRWVRRDGVAFLGALGIVPGDAVVDFGCGWGAYSLPAARLVGERGLVISVDVNVHVLSRLRRRAAAEGLPNIHAVSDLDAAKSLLEARPCQAVLLYDVLHFMDTGERERLYAAFRGVLDAAGRLSIHPKHVNGDQPARFLQDSTVEDIIREVANAGFHLADRKTARLWHDHGQTQGTVLTFCPAATGPGERLPAPAHAETDNVCTPSEGRRA
ncbi:MAG: hypothetical protein BWZ02_00186 [Lentisphaerae bacterium ADurb.BinA184]|nr:MAG: hypothetical protein BWZ02_00186 [Lentisphaerae bacterium ADurb.BinA184]